MTSGTIMTAVNYKGWEITSALQLQKAEYVSLCLAPWHMSLMCVILGGHERCQLRMTPNWNYLASATVSGEG